MRHWSVIWNKKKTKMRCFVRVSNTFSQLEWLRVSLFFFCVNIMTFMNESPCLYSQHFHHHVYTRNREIDRAQWLRSPFYEFCKFDSHLCRMIHLWSWIKLLYQLQWFTAQNMFHVVCCCYVYSILRNMLNKFAWSKIFS